MELDLGAPVQLAESGLIPLHLLNAHYVIGREPATRWATLLARSEPWLAVDIETEGVGAAAMRVKAVTVGTANHAVILDPRDPVQADTVRSVLQTVPTIVLHNAPFDIPVLVRLGLMRSVDIRKVRDTLVYCRLAEPDELTSKSLLAAGGRYLGGEVNDVLTKAFKDLGLTKTVGFKTFDLDRGIYQRGAALDVIVTARLYPLVREAAYRRLTEGHPFKGSGVSGADAWELVDREQVINRMFIARAAKGLRVDLDRLDAYRASVLAQQDKDRAALETVGVKPGNGGSLTRWLEERGALPADHPRTAKTGAASSQADHLKVLDHPIAQAFVRLKMTEKVEKDYLQKVVDLADDATGCYRVHPTTTILGAATGRMSMSGPPLQQFPAEARGIVLADEGDQLTSIDWSQIEPVVAANLAKDHKVLAGYEDGSSDLYSTVAAVAGITRKHAKVVVLAQMYGEGMKKLAADLGISQNAAYRLRDTVFNAMPGVAKLITKLRNIGDQHRLVITLSGRILPIPIGQFGVAVHKAVNYFVQGSAYDVLAEALVRIDAAGLSDAVYLAMHDELVVSTDAADEVERIMRTPPERLCQMAGRHPVLRTDRADLGERWAAA
ncbi:MAG TPA: DNA polymerase [Candidatus Binatia bacterium]|nr:DNA polymerase [Candidatus Binatia bacterium]